MSECEFETTSSLAEKCQSQSDKITEVDLFLENCSSLYNLILDAIHDLSSKSLSCQQLEDMAQALAECGRRLAMEQSEHERTVELRINTINSAMEQLRLRKGHTSDSETGSTRSQPSSEIRSWIHVMERRLNEFEQRLMSSRTQQTLTKLLADQQVVQLEIQSEGQIQINRLVQQLRNEELDECSDQFERRNKALEALRNRWYRTLLDSHCLQVRIEVALGKHQEPGENESDPEFVGPPNKRARRDDDTTEEDEDSEDEDTLPFGESEYESIMDGRTTITSTSSEDSPIHSKKWDSAAQDVGYSSGENSVHEALNTLDDKGMESSARRRIECSPVKSFYRTVQLEELGDDDAVVPQYENELFVENNPLSDSMHVNHDLNTTTNSFTEYDEVMALFEDDIMPKDVMNESFTTQWREITGKHLNARRTKPVADDVELLAKNSCDASSEESSDWESRDGHVNIMSRSYNSSFLESSNSLKRQRNHGKHSFLQECSEMNASFCSTRSDLPPCASRSLRKKLRVRRLPRSMSDGEQLGVKSGLLTPMIRVSPPGTPLARSTKLLQRLDQALEASNTESDTAPEQSDAPAYEWDEYHPPAKDEMVLDDYPVASSSVVEELLSVDEDFSRHFGAQETVRRLVEESRAHIHVVEKSIELAALDVNELKNIEMVVKTNLRQLDSALRIGGIPLKSELHQLKKEWAALAHRMTSPMPQILNKVERFANSLRDLQDSSATSALLNGVSAISSKEDARLALDALVVVEKRLSKERDELRDLLSSELFTKELHELSSEFSVISCGYDEAVRRIGSLVHGLRLLNAGWNEWTDKQNDIRQTMSLIEKQLREGTFEQRTVLEEMELCQERMNSLETMCNYLTTSLNALQEDSPNKAAPDFMSELTLYANALEQLKNKFNDVTRVPTPPKPSSPLPPPVPAEPTATTRKRRATQTNSSQTVTREQTLTNRVKRTVSGSPLIKCLLVLSFLSAVLALFYATIFGWTFGPHLTYVNGPPPV